MVAAELPQDARTSHLLERWGLAVPKPHGLATVGGVVGLLRMRGAAVLAAAAGGGAGSAAAKGSSHKPRQKGPGLGGHGLRPVPLSQRVWARQLSLTCDLPVVSEPPRPSLSVEAWAQAAASVHATAKAVGDVAGGIAVPRHQWPPAAESIYKALVEAVEFGGAGMGSGWQVARLTEGVDSSVVHGYMCAPCFAQCKHCRLELLELELAAASAPGGHGRRRPKHHRTADGLAVCHADGLTYTFRLPRALSLAWCIQVNATACRRLPSLCFHTDVPLRFRRRSPSATWHSPLSWTPAHPAAHSCWKTSRRRPWKRRRRARRRMRAVPPVAC